MRTSMSNLTVSLVALGAILLSGCALDGADEHELIVDEEIAPASQLAGKADGTSIPLTEFYDNISGAGPAPAREIFTRADSYRDFFGHDAPNVDFSKEWVIFYSAGQRFRGGVSVSIDSIQYSEDLELLEIGTTTTTAGPSCFVTSAFTTPYVLVKFPIPSPRPHFAKYFHSDTVKDCE